MKDFINILDCQPDQIRQIFDLALQLRNQRESGQANPPMLQGKTYVLIFEKPSLRTRVSFEQAIFELGGRAITMAGKEVGLGKREKVGDVAQVLQGMVHGVIARVFEHHKLTELAESCRLPVINALSDYSHPCQALADLLTIRDEFGPDLTNRKLVFVGDGNNVARSLAALCAVMGVEFALAAPDGYQLEDSFLDHIRRQYPNAKLAQSNDLQIISDADVLYTDTWVSMGQEEERIQRMKIFNPYKIDEQLLATAPDHAIVLHCLPAYRGVEITDAVIDGPQSRVFPQAHNRLHAQKGLIAFLCQQQTENRP